MSGRPAVAGLVDAVRPYLRGYSAVLFCDDELVGLLVLVVTFVRPEVGVAGLLAALAARMAAKQLGYADQGQPPEIYNALFLGLMIGATWNFTPVVALLAVTGGVAATLAAHVLRGWLWRLDRLPAFSLGAVAIGWLFILVAPAATALTPHAQPAWLGESVGPVDAPLRALGWLLFTPHPLAGAALLAALLLRSRYLAVLCLAGYGVGAGLILVLGASLDPAAAGFNFMLAAMGVGGIFAVPDKASFGWALFAALMAALLAIALHEPLARFGLPPLTTPFILSTHLVLAGLAARIGGGRPWLLLDAPAMPERSLRAVALARARLGEPGSVALSSPVLGTWTLSQAIDGEHTHRGAWRHA